jgi:hypothetical protein
MNFKKILILLVVLGVLIIAIYKADKVNQKKEEQKKVVSMKTDDIMGLELIQSNNKIILKKVKDSWFIKAPIKTNADDFAVNRVIDDFAEIESEKTVEKDCFELEKYGLKEPKLGVKLIDKKGKTITLFFGEKAPTGDYYYAKLKDSNTVFLLSEIKKKAAEKTDFDLRDRHLIKFDTDNLNAYIIEKIEDKTILEIKKEGDNWFFAKPKKALAKSSEIDSMISAIHSLEAETIYKDSPSEEELKNYNLDKPIFIVTLSLGKAKGEVKLYVSKKDDKWYAYSKGSNFIAEISSNFKDDIDKKFDELREKKVAVFPGYDVDKITIIRKGKKYLMVKDENGVWRLKTPEKFILDDSKVSELISAFEELEAKEIIDNPVDLGEYGLAKPQITVDFHLQEENRDVVLYIGNIMDNNIFVKNKNFTNVFKTGKDFISKLKFDKIRNWERKEKKISKEG